MELKKLFEKQKHYLDQFYTHLDLKVCEQFIEKVLQCKGVLYFTGVGKSGFVAQKIAATMMSTGTKAFFLPPIDALHGDLGMVGDRDFVLILSKSGETEELLQLLPFIRNKGAKVFGIVSQKESRLVKGADFSVILPCQGEICPFDLAPTTSTEIQLLFGDVMAMALMQAKGFNLDQYADNHPGGQIGRRSSMRVRDVMLNKTRLPLCLSENRLEEVLRELTEKRCGCLIVIDEQRRLKGIFTDGDLRRALQAKGEAILKAKIEELMTRAPKAIQSEALAWDAMKLMESDQKHPVMVLPVLDEAEEVVGILKMHDLIQAGL